jgi:hypothetical protein
MRAMTESEGRAVLLVRAFEAAPSSAWSEADAAWASAEARRMEGGQVSFERFLARRAALACARLVQRDSKVDAALVAAGPHVWIGWMVVLVAFLFGVASDAIGPTDRINILAPPLLAVLVWNLGVYLALLVRSGGAVRRLASYIAALGWRRKRPAGPALARFVRDWAAASGTLQALRAAFVLHAGAAAFVLGALASLYLRGIAFEYRAGWDSTFLTPPAVQRVLSFVLGPASFLSGISLPELEGVAQLRFSRGPGENAARWIHLYALTLAMVVIVPRVVLAAVAAWRVRTGERSFPFQFEGEYFDRLRRTLSGNPVAALILPYNLRVPDEARPALIAALERTIGPNVSVSVTDSLPEGAEDDLQRWLGEKNVPLAVALFRSTSTPERETHGAFVEALAAHPAVARVLVFIDEAEFRRRFTGAEGARRVTERRGAWQRMLADTGIEPVFVDLAMGA